MHTEELPKTEAKKPQRREVRWIPLTGLATGTGTPVLGVMELTVWLSSRRSVVCSYVVTERPTAWDGRAFHLAKSGEQKGSDDEEREYDVFLARNGQDKKCGCKGFERHGHCKHQQGLEALLKGGKL